MLLQSLLLLVPDQPAAKGQDGLCYSQLDRFVAYAGLADHGQGVQEMPNY